MGHPGFVVEGAEGISPGLKPGFSGVRGVRAEARTYLRNKSRSGFLRCAAE